jgi:hypothetical protein
MKTPIAVLGFAAAALCAGSALAQNAPRGPAPRGGNTPPPAVRSVPPVQPAGEARGTGVGAGAPDGPQSIETGQMLDRGRRPWPRSDPDTTRPSNPGPVWRDPNIISVAPGQPAGQTGRSRVGEQSRETDNGPAGGIVPAGQGQGQTRGTGGDGSNRDHIDQDAQLEIPGTAGFQTNLGATPVNGVGGTGGGRYTSRPRVINNSETDVAQVTPPLMTNNSETDTGLAVGTVPAGQGQGQRRGTAPATPR